MPFLTLAPHLGEFSAFKLTLLPCRTHCLNPFHQRGQFIKCCASVTGLHLSHQFDPQAVFLLQGISMCASRLIRAHSGPFWGCVQMPMGSSAPVKRKPGRGGLQGRREYSGVQWHGQFIYCCATSADSPPLRPFRIILRPELFTGRFDAKRTVRLVSPGSPQDSTRGSSSFVE